MATLTLRPNAVGDEESITSSTSGAGNHWQDVDEATPDETTTQVYTTSTTYQRDLYNIPNHTSEASAINFIKIYFRCYNQQWAGSSWAKPSLKSNSTVTDGTEVSLTTTWTTYSQQWNTNPADSAAWEWADIDALQIGVSLIASIEGRGHCTQVYVEVDYTPDATVIVPALNIMVAVTVPAFTVSSKVTPPTVNIALVGNIPELQGGSGATVIVPALNVKFALFSELMHVITRNKTTRDIIRLKLGKPAGGLRGGLR